MQFIQARHFTDTGPAGRRVDLWVVHDMEYPEKPDSAEVIARMFATTDREASAHFNFDNNSCVQGVRDEDIAWAAPGANNDGLQAEHAGYAAQRREDWRDKFSSDMLELSAEICANRAERHEYPAIYRDQAALKAGMRGITSHHQVSLAFKLSSHTDPGPGFPMDRYVKMVRHRLSKDHDKHVDHERTELPDVHEGDAGWLVKKVQKHLRRHGYKLDVDGHFGPQTAAAVRRFQREEELVVSGVVDRRTWRRLRS